MIQRSRVISSVVKALTLYTYIINKGVFKALPNIYGSLFCENG